MSAVPKPIFDTALAAFDRVATNGVLTFDKNITTGPAVLMSAVTGRYAGCSDKVTRPQFIDFLEKNADALKTAPGNFACAPTNEGEANAVLFNMAQYLRPNLGAFQAPKLCGVKAGGR